VKHSPEQEDCSALEDHDPKSPILTAVKRAVQKATNVAKAAHTSNVMEALHHATKAVSSQRGRLQHAKDRVQHGGVRSTVGRWFMRRNLLPFYLKDPPGLKMDVLYGATTRLPVDGSSMLITARSLPRSRAVPPDESQTELAASLQPRMGALLRAVQVQPHLKLCACLTMGKFRRHWLDHTKVEGSLDVGLRRSTDFGMPDFSNRLGITHLAALSLRQQIWGPLRACADMRWRLSPDGDGEGQHVPGPELGSRLRCHVASLQAQRLDGTYGLEAVAGVASLAMWYCPVRRQGMVELRA
jgi:hypothetical protein